jgi:hypothetical protein
MTNNQQTIPSFPSATFSSISTSYRDHSSIEGISTINATQSSNSEE